MLGDIARQVEWPKWESGQWVTGKLSKEDWKQVFTSARRRGQRMAQGLEGGMVVFGESASKMGKREMSEIITMAYAFGNERKVQWTDPEWKSLMETYAQVPETA